jgi:8-oxo-dGTP diphosphatase
MAIHKAPAIPCSLLGSGAQEWGGHGGGEAITMGITGDTTFAADVAHRRRVVVDVILLLARNGRILLRERANTGYGDGAYEPPSGQLADRETIVETAIRVASAAGIEIGAENVSLGHVMHDVSGGGRIAFFLSVSGWTGQPASPDVRWFPAGDLPTNMLDWARVALRNYADGMRFSTYPAFAPAGAAGANGFHVVNGSSAGSSKSSGDNESSDVNGQSGSGGADETNGFSGTNGIAPRGVSPARWEEAYSGHRLG